MRSTLLSNHPYEAYPIISSIVFTSADSAWATLHGALIKIINSPERSADWSTAMPSTCPPRM